MRCPAERQGYDLVVVHQVLHYLDDPGRALKEAGRVLRPGGRLVVVDFAPHGEESLRDQHAHRRLGFSRAELDGFLSEAGLVAAAGRSMWRRSPTRPASSPSRSGSDAIRASSPIAPMFSEKAVA